MATNMEKTKTPGIYRRGCRYTFSYRDRGRQRWASARTLAEARKGRDRRRTEVYEGTHRARSPQRFDDYARAWVDSYQGRTTRGFRDSTRKGYRFSIEHRVIPFFSKHVGLLAELEPQHVRVFVAWLFENKRKPAVSTVRGHVAALKVMLATAVEDGLIVHNPASGVRISRPGTPMVEKDARERRRALDSKELERFLNACDPDWRLFFELLAMSGLRVGEAVELRWKDIDFGAKRLRVRRQFYRGAVAPPKSKEGTRDIPLSQSMAQRMWTRRAPSEALVFTSVRGQRVDRDWCWKNVLKPAAKGAGVPWVGYHTFRHTCASILFAGGKNPKQVQAWLGHSDPAFTLKTYVHLIDDGLGDADFMDANSWAACEQECEQKPSHREQIAEPPKGPKMAV